MALFKICKGPSEVLGRPDSWTHKAKEGYAYFTPDDGKFYIDIQDSDDVIVGTSSANGANRICINSGGGGGLGDVLVLNCGTATTVTWGSGDPVVTETLYFNCGNAGSVTTADTPRLILGGAVVPEISNQTIFYDCGNSKTE